MRSGYVTLRRKSEIIMSLSSKRENFSPARFVFFCRKLDSKQSSLGQLCHFETVLCKTSFSCSAVKVKFTQKCFLQPFSALDSMALVTVALDLLFCSQLRLSTRFFEAVFGAGMFALLIGKYSPVLTLSQSASSHVPITR